MAEKAFSQTRWSLQDLLPATHGPEFESIVAHLESAVSELESSRELLSPGMAVHEFARLMGVVETIRAVAVKLRAYAGLWYTEDTQDQDALAFRGRIEKLQTNAQNRALFFELWWKMLDDSAAARLLEGSGDNRYYLESLRSYRPYTLSEPEEKVINLKDVNGVDALVTIYEMITNAFLFKVEIDGRVRELTRGELMVYCRDARPEVRAAVYQEMYRVFEEQAVVLGQIYQHVVRDWASDNLTLRGFATPIAARNLRNDIPDQVVDTLLEVCRENAELFQRYFKLKAGWVGLEKLRRYDIYAPLRESEKVYTFNEAAEMALASLQGFSPLLAGHARRVLRENHIDSEIRSRKDTGAFCWSVLPGQTPWVLVNYNGRPGDVATLAHELGHAVHSLMAAGHSVLTFHSTLPMAETASGFAEVLLLERQLEGESDAQVRRDILARFVDDAYATIMRQAYFALFERKAHSLVEEGRSVAHLADSYLENLEEQFGEAVELSEEFRWEWVTIPHLYHTPFYCYAYSFGQLLVLALYRRFRSEGESFVPRYLRILEHGGSLSPTQILDEAGVDVTSPAFWQGGFDVIEDMIRELEGLS